MREYAPPESEAASRRAMGRRLLPLGLIAAAGGIVGIFVSMVLKAIWLGILGGPVAFLSWIALIGGVAAAWYGYTLSSSGRTPGD
ncbi:MAG: hypothetical protein R3C52_08770 [Hyphomonadaceae bacterium]